VGGATPAASGAGISFPAAFSSSSDVNTLDDYEEGTFTPTIVGTSTAGTGTYTTQFGKYTKVGNVVTLVIWLTWVAHTGTGNMRVAGIPFVTPNDGTQEWISLADAATLTITAGSVLCVYFPSNASQIVVGYISPGTAGINGAVAMDTAATITFGLTYITA
jgi:hypothetical protein